MESKITKSKLLRRALAELKLIKRHVSPAQQSHINELYAHIKAFESDHPEPQRFGKVAKLLGGTSFFSPLYFHLLDTIVKLNAGNDPEKLIHKLYCSVFHAQYHPLIRALPRNCSIYDSPQEVPPYQNRLREHNSD